MKIRKPLIVTLFVTLCVSLGAFATACAKNTYTVTFDVLGHGVAPQALTEVVEGSKIQKPDDPQETGFTFNGWYKDDKLNNVWNFDTDTVNSDTTLYASWDSVKYSVTYNMLGHGVAPQAHTEAHGSLVQRPQDPEEDGFAFNGWYKDEACKNLWNFYADKVTADTVLYAGWKPVYPVAYDTAFNREVDDAEYFGVANTGTYILTVSVEDGTEGSSLNYLFDGAQTSAVLTENGTSYTYLYLEEGTHKLGVINKKFNAKVTLQALVTPFDTEEAYMGSSYSLTVAEAGDVPVFRFGDTNTDYQARAIDFDGTFYTVEVKKTSSGGAFGYELVKIKINKSAGKVASIEVYTKTAGEWNTTAADTLEKARYASNYVYDIHYSATGEENEGEVVRTFKYAYYCVLMVKNEWVEFSNFAEGTEFYWCNLNTGREGQMEEKINVVAGQPMRLADNERFGYLDYIAVKPANGETSVSFTLKTVPEPVVPGESAETPVELTLGETYSCEWKREVPCYFTFNIEEAGKYRITAYWTYYNDKKELLSAVLDGITDFWQAPKTDQFLTGYEKEFEAGSEHTLVIKANSENLVVLVEKVELGGLVSGTYVGISGTYKYFITIDTQKNTAFANKEHKVLGSGTNSNIIAETSINNDGEKYFFGGEIVEGELIGALYFTVNNDGSLKVRYGGDPFDVTLQS